MRLFIAINFDPQVKQKILEVQNKLRKIGQGNFTKPENLHLTLAFLGEVAPDRMEAVKQAMKQLPVVPMALTFDRVGNFQRNGGIWWIGLSENPELLKLQEKLRGLLTAAGFKLETRRFSPHITLAREVSLSSNPDQKNLLGAPFTAYADTVSLMLSQRISGRLIYTEQYAVQAKKELRS